MKLTENTINILGLSPTEQAVYNALSSPKNVQDISQETGVSRTGINHILKNLSKRGLLHILKVGKRHSYTQLRTKEIAQKIQRALDDINLSENDRQGARIKTSRENEFIIHVGAKEIIPAYQRIAFENRNERIRAIQHHRSWNELVEKITPKQLVDFNESIKQNNLILDGMLNQSAYADYQKELLINPKKHKEVIQSLEGRMADYTVFDDRFFNHDAEIWIFKATTLIINWKEEVAIEITNSNMTGFLKDMFEFVKAGGKKIDHNKAMRELKK